MGKMPLWILQWVHLIGPHARLSTFPPAPPHLPIGLLGTKPVLRFGGHLRHEGDIRLRPLRQHCVPLGRRH